MSKYFKYICDACSCLAPAVWSEELEHWVAPVDWANFVSNTASNIGTHFCSTCVLQLINKKGKK